MPTALTADDVVSGIAKKLQSAFKGEVDHIYKNTPLQGVQKPYFFIEQVSTYHDKELRTRGERRYFMDVHCHPEESTDYTLTWLNYIGDKLFEVLDTITITQSIVYGRTMRFEIRDNVLHFFVEYRFKVNKIETEGIKMQTLQEDTYSHYGYRDL